jgi:hypothetical protein
MNVRFWELKAHLVIGILSSDRGVAESTRELCNSNIESKTSLIVFSVIPLLADRIIRVSRDYAVSRSLSS